MGTSRAEGYGYGYGYGYGMGMDMGMGMGMGMGTMGAVLLRVWSKLCTVTNLILPTILIILYDTRL